MKALSLSMMILAGAVLQAADDIGKRPYELDWAGRMAASLRAEGLDVLAARPIQHSLEDVFISRIQAREAEAAQNGVSLS